MAVFVDELRPSRTTQNRICHMMADTLAELAEMAALLKLPTASRVQDFYLLNNKQRNLALYYGARAILEKDVKELREKVRTAKELKRELADAQAVLDRENQS